jgi:hypothetical protein
MATPTPAPFVVQPQLTALAIAYKNQAMIADQILPRVQVESPDFKYTVFTQADTFTIPDTRVGRTSAPNQVDWSATENTASVQDHALDQPVPYRDVKAAQAASAVAGVMPVDPEARATEQLSDLILLDREKRAADLVFAAGSYASANVEVLAGTSQWSDFTNSNPINDILSALDQMIVRANTLTLGQAVWTKLRQHPKVVQAIYGTAATSGVVTREQVAALLEIPNLIVGQGWLNSAKKGQNPSLVRLWGKHASLLYINPLAVSAKDLTFGITAQWGSRVAGSTPDSNIGMLGGTMVRVGESVKELVVANDVGYFFENAVA